MIGVTLALLGLGLLAAGILTARVDSPPPVEVSANGATEIPRTYFFQHPWVLFGDLEDPRRVPTLAEVGCRPLGPLSAAPHTPDLTAYGSRVVDDEPIHALAVLSRSGDDAGIECSEAGAKAPLWLMPASEAPTLTPTAMTIFAFALLVAGALVHPATSELRLRGRDGRRPGRA